MDLNTILCTGAGAVIVGGLGYLAKVTGVNDKIINAIKGGSAPQTTIAGHPKETEALDALEAGGFAVLKDLVVAHPDCLATLETKLDSDSLTNVGSWLATTYGPELLADAIKEGEKTLGVEMSVIFGGSKGVEEAAVQRLGIAAKNNLPSLKQLIVAPSGRVVVGVAPAAK